LLEALYIKHTDKFDRILEVRGRIPFFSRNKEDVDVETKEAVEIDDTSIYANSAYNSGQLIDRAYLVLEKFGYSQDSITFEYR